MAPVLQVRVDDEVKASIESAAAARGQNRSEWLRTAVDHLLAAQSSGGGESGAVGTSPVPPTADAGEQQPSAPPEPASSPPSAAPAASPATAPRTEPPPIPNCPDCGAPGGQHQGYCIRVTGEPPVRAVGRTTELERKPAETTPLENQEQFVARRREELLAEGQNDVMATAIAEGEWRKRLAPPEPAAQPAAAAVAPPAFQQEACGSCGLMKLPTEQCRDCGARPTIIL